MMATLGWFLLAVRERNSLLVTAWRSHSLSWKPNSIEKFQLEVYVPEWAVQSCLTIIMEHRSGAQFNRKNNPTRNPSRHPTSFPSRFHVLENDTNWVVETCLRIKLVSRWKTQWISCWIIYSIESGPCILSQNSGQKIN